MGDPEPRWRRYTGAVGTQNLAYFVLKLRLRPIRITCKAESMNFRVRTCMGLAYMSRTTANHYVVDQKSRFVSCVRPGSLR